MGYNFIEYNREQQYLLPPSLKEWVPEGDLAWFVLDAVKQMDLGEFYKGYRADGSGGMGFDPEMKEEQESGKKKRGRKPKEPSENTTGEKRGRATG